MDKFDLAIGAWALDKAKQVAEYRKRSPYSYGTSKMYKGDVDQLTPEQISIDFDYRGQGCDTCGHGGGEYVSVYVTKDGSWGGLLYEDSIWDFPGLIKEVLEFYDKQHTT